MLFSSYHFVTVMMKTMTIKAKVKNSPILTWPMMSLRNFLTKSSLSVLVALHSTNRYSFVIVYIIQASEIEVHFPIRDPPFPPKASSHSTFEKVTISGAPIFCLSPSIRMQFCNEIFFEIETYFLERCEDKVLLPCNCMSWNVNTNHKRILQVQFWFLSFLLYFLHLLEMYIEIVIISYTKQWSFSGFF